MTPPFIIFSRNGNEPSCSKADFVGADWDESYVVSVSGARTPERLAVPSCHGRR